MSQTRAGRRTRPNAAGTGMTRRRIRDAAFVALLTALAATPLWPVYESSAFVVVGVASLVLGGAIAVAAAARRLPAYAVAALTAVTFLLFGVALAVPTQATFRILPTAEGLRSLVFGVATSWKQMLSVDLPLGDYEALLEPALIVLLAGTVVGVSLALRARRPGWAILAPGECWRSRSLSGRVPGRTPSPRASRSPSSRWSGRLQPASAPPRPTRTATRPTRAVARPAGAKPRAALAAWSQPSCSSAYAAQRARASSPRRPAHPTVGAKCCAKPCSPRSIRTTTSAHWPRTATASRHPARRPTC
ncbi:hypothetical protein AX769_13985 [Frondihabitans sp. PAMC 28766]|uniref:hypothetical protein n=1 Tax=Frondihabitans sp. PAMC 28766 TaxID=1795630 RepID=UPI00078D2738|nr:hypothetical protein [Frondihabitans sp. PAMC 28766]AMM21043.1 hypothetical protein AX769_13985 [Frondihabitans sp. PAMC 28766]